MCAHDPKAPGFGVQLVSPVEPHQLVEGDLTWRHTFAECRVGDRSAKGHRQYSTGGAKRSHRKPDAVGFVVRSSTDPLQHVRRIRNGGRGWDYLQPERVNRRHPGRDVFEFTRRQHPVEIVAAEEHRRARLQQHR